MKKWKYRGLTGKHIRLREILLGKLENIPDAVREKQWKRKQKRKLSREKKRRALFREKLERYIEKTGATGELRKWMLELGDDSVEVRCYAAEKLGGFVDERAEIVLNNSVKNDDNVGVKLSAGMALGRIRDKRENMAMKRR